MSCLKDDITFDADRPAVINLQIKAAGSINTDEEDRVTEVRMIVFKLTGETVYNDMLVFPAGIENACQAVALKPSTYNFYFFANESANPALSAALASVGNVSQLRQDARFRQLAYNPAFQPDLNTSAGRFLMSAIYENVQVEGGGTEDNPLPLQLSTEKVELIRALSKVEIVFRKKTPGINIINTRQIASVGLLNVAGVTDIPPADDYYGASNPVAQSPVLTPASGLEELDYGQDEIGSVVFYVPELLNSPENPARYTQLNINNRTFPIVTDKGRIGLLAQRRDVALSDSSVIRNYHYQIVANIDAQGDVFLQTEVVPWRKSRYSYMFQDEDQSIVIPPVEPTNPGVVIPTLCGAGGRRIEVRYNNETLNNGLSGAFGDVINMGGQGNPLPSITNPRGFTDSKVNYCERLYGKGWRFMDACEMMSLLAIFDQAQRVFDSNTQRGIKAGLPFYGKEFRLQAADLLSALSGVDVTAYKATMRDDSQVVVGANGVATGSAQDGNFSNESFGIANIPAFSPGDVIVTRRDNVYPNWPYPGPIATGAANTPPATGWWYPVAAPNVPDWYPMMLQHSYRGYWLPGYLQYVEDPADPNYNKILYSVFVRYSTKTTTRCVRVVP
jgi:hypothetical protein